MASKPIGRKPTVAFDEDSDSDEDYRKPSQTKKPLVTPPIAAPV